MTNDELLLRTIRYLRFLLMAGIVFIHFNISGGISFNGINYGLDNPTVYYIILFFCDVFPHISVPSFLFLGFPFLLS